MKQKPRNRKGILRNKFILVFAGAVALALGLWALDRADVVNLPFLSDDKAAQDLSGSSGINYGPPTEQEKKETEEFKDRQGSDSNTTPPPPPAGQKRSITPIITSWGQNPSTSALEGSGYIAGIIESGGTCTLTATKGSVQMSESIGATQNAQNVSCGLISIPRSQLSAGTWSLTLSYISTVSGGTSKAQNQEVK